MKAHLSHFNSVCITVSIDTWVRNIWVFSPLIPSKREKNILWVFFDIIVNFIIQKLKSKQFGCGIFKMVGPKKQDFWEKINIHKGNHCILRIRGAIVCQKLGMILENIVVQKLKLEKNVFYIKWSH